jgi:hypothetical protein
MEPTIKVNNGEITIDSFKCPKGLVPQTTTDLSPYAGEYMRIWLDADLTYSLDKHKDHYWQVAELKVPTQKYQSIDTGKVDEQGLPITTSEPIPIELGEIRLFDIEEE